jgi:hypothetical protein
MKSAVGSTAHALSRRRLLRGMGAAGLLLSPFVRLRSSLAAAADSGNLLIFFTPNSHYRQAFGAETPGTGFSFLPSLAPLEPVRNDITVIKGLSLRSPTSIRSHEDVCRILTCVSGPDKFKAYGPSIDHAIGMEMNQRPMVVAVDPYRESPHWRTLLSWRASGVNEPFVKDHKAVFADVFGGLAANTNTEQMAVLERTRARNKSVLDLVNKDLATFRTRINSHDRVNLDAYLDSLRTVEEKIGRLAVASCDANPLQTRISGLTGSVTQNDDRSGGGLAAQLKTRGELHMDMIAAAFACGTRRIATVQWQGASEGYDPFSDQGSPTHHTVSHYGVPEAPARWAAIDKWYAERFAYTVSALKKVGVLDRTIVAWVSEISQEHTLNNHVIVTAGGQALGMKTGQYVLYPFTGQEGQHETAARDPKNKSLSDLWVTVQQALGVKKDTFGDAEWNDGPLAELRT